MADVFAADDEVLRRRVAVKLFRFDTPAGDDQRRAEAEIRTLAGLRHPGLVTVFDAGSVSDGGDPTPFIVMELISGPTLAQRIAGGPLPPEQVRRLGMELAATLAYVHSQGIVHRDIKPANVLLDTPAGASAAGPADPDGATAVVPGVAAAAGLDGHGVVTKLTDFGIAVLLDSTRLTTVGMTVGTANYLSPEQATTGHVTPASDIYSLGLVLLECLTGELAYPGTGVAAAAARVHRQPELPAWLTPAWRRLLASMTAYSPAERPSAAEVNQQLAALSDVAVPTGSATAPLEATGVRVGGTRLLRTGAAGGAAVGAAARRWGWLGWRAAAGAAALLVILVVALVAVLSTGSPTGSRTGSPTGSQSSSQPAQSRLPATPAAATTAAARPSTTPKAPAATGGKHKGKGNGNGPGNGGG
jgi:serine/threonine protein kinase